MLCMVRDISDWALTDRVIRLLVPVPKKKGSVSVLVCMVTHVARVYLQPMIPPTVNVLTFSPLTGGCSEGLGAFRFFF